MKTKTTSTGPVAKVSSKGLLALVSGKLKDRVFFPEKQEEAKQYMRQVKPR